MNQTSFDFNTGQNEQQKFAAIRSAIRFFGGYIAVVLVTLFYVIGFVVELIFPKTATIGLMAGELYLLAFIFVYIVFYSVATTNTVSNSIVLRLEHVVKRFIEVTMVCLALPWLALALFLLAIAIVLESPGPILYRSKRIGQFGIPFDKYLFRTVRIAPAEGGITKVGKWMRKTSTNELPALINVLIGDMSLIGPMIHRPQDLDAVLELDHQRVIFTVRPGLSGLAQLRLGIPKEEDIKLDIEYVQNWSLALDVKLLRQTVMNALKKQPDPPKI